jgi:hypothetical protein
MMDRQHFRFVSSCVALLLAASVSTKATTLARMSLAKMSQTAQVIMRGRCLENSTSWDAGEIWTFTSFEVREVWRGSAPARITVRLLGGRVGNLTSSVSGVPRFHPGEEVVLFLERTRRGDFSVVSWEQGSFRIHRDIFSGQESVTQDTASFATFDPATHQFEMSGIRKLPIDAFRARVDAALSGGNGRKQ